MEEKILFDIQLFADTEVISAGQSATIDGITYTAKNGNITIDVDTTKKSATVNGDAEISESIYQAVTGYTFKVNNATINGITFNGNGNVTYGKNHWFVTLDSAFTIGNGTQPLGGLDITTDKKVNLKLYAVGGGEDTVNVGGTKFSSKSSGNVEVDRDEINLSGNVSASKNLKEKNVTTSGEGTVNLLLAEGDELTIDGATYKAEDAAVVSVTDKKVTSESGTLTVMPKNSITINNVSYTAENNSSTIKLDEGDATLSGKFTLKTDSENFVKINKINVKGDSFTFDSADKNFAGDFEIKSSYGRNFKVNGVGLTVDGETATADVTSSLTKLTGSYTVGDGTTSLTGKSFEVSAGEVSFQTLKNDSVKINDATFGGKENFKLTAYFADNNVIKVDGTDITINGNGKFILVYKAAKINGVDFTAANAYAQVDYAEDSTVTLSNAFTIGDGSQNINKLKISAQSVIKGSTFKLGTSDSITIGGVTYSGDGEISVDANDTNKITLSGKISSVTEEVAGNLTSKNFTVENANTTVDFILSNENDTVTINDKIYKATSDKASIQISNGTVTSANIVTVTDGDTQTVDLELSATKKTVTYDGVTFTATGTAQVDGETKVAAVTVEEKTVTIDDGTEVSKKIVTVTGGNVEIKFENKSDVTYYTFNLGQDAAATINDVTFKQESNESTADGDIVFNKDEIILNTAFTVGNGTQKLGGAKFKLGTSAKSTFILGGDNDSVTVENYSELAESGNVTGDTDTVTGITYTGNGTVQVSGTTITLDGTISVESTVDVSSYTFNLTNGKSYTFGATTIDATSATVNVSGISPTTLTSSTSLSSVTIGEKTFNITNGGSYTISLNESGNISSISNVATGASFSADNKIFGVSTGTATFNFNSSGAVTSITATSDATVTIGGTNYTLANGKTLTSYNSGWFTAQPYDSYTLEVNGTSYTLKAGDATLTADNYSDYFTVSSSSANLSSGIKMQVVNKGNGNFTMNSGGNSYTIAGGAAGTFNSSDTDGITKVDSGTITAANSSAVGTDLGDNAALKVGTTYTYTENGSDTSASITVDENGNVIVSNGEIKKNIASGTFTYGEETYTVTSAAEFKVTSAISDGASLTGGTGTRSINQGDTFTLNGNNNTTYTADSGAKFVATGDNNGGSVNFSGTAKYSATLTDTTETFNGKTYTFNGNATYQLTGTGGENGTSTKLYAATGTRELTETGVTKTYNSDTYTVTGGTYSVTVADGSISGNESLTAGNATYSTDGGTFHYNNNVYTATTRTQLNISFNGDNVTEETKSGAGTRDKLTNETVSADGATYTLSNGAKILLTFGTSPEENFYSGNATRQLSANDTFTVTGNANTYTATDNTATLTLTRTPGNNDTIAITGGNGTRTDNTANQTFTINNQTYTNTADAVVYILKANATSEELQAAQGTRTNVAGDKYAYGNQNHTYNLTSGTYSIDISNGTGTDTLTAGEGTATITTETFTVNSKDYTPMENVSLKIVVSDNGNTQTESFTSGKGTRTDTKTNAATFTSGGKTYDNTGDITYSIIPNASEIVYAAQGTRLFSNTDTATLEAYEDTYTVTDGTYNITVNGGAGEETLVSGNATYTTDGGTFHYNGKAYTETGDGSATFTIDFNNHGESYSLTDANGTGTRTAQEQFKYVSEDGNTYTVNDNSIIQVAITNKDTSTETFKSGTATATYTTNSGTFHFGSQTYTASDTATLTLNKNDSTETVTLSGKGTRSDSESTFVHSGNSQTYTLTEGNIVYIVEDNAAEVVYSAKGTRDFNSSANQTYPVTNGNTYTMTGGVYEIDISAKTGTDTVKSGTATYAITENDSFVYSGKTYTAKNNTTFTLAVDNFNSTETFVSGSGELGGTYIINKSSAQIDGTTYANSAADNVVNITTSNNAITGVDGALTATFGSKAATIGGISYSGGTTLTINSVDDVTAAAGDFTASGNFQNAKTVKINSKDLTISGDSAVGFKFGTGGVTEINNLSNGATVTNAAGATKAVSDANGTFTFGSQTITIENDSTAGATFTLDGNGGPTKIEGIQRDDSGEYVKITIGGNTYSIRKTGDTLTKKSDGTWEASAFNATAYTVTYENNKFTVKATVDNSEITLTTDDYTVTATKELTFKTTLKSAPVTVTNKTSDAVKVGGVTGIGSGTIKLDSYTANSFKVNEKSYTVTNGIFTVENGVISVKASDTSTVSITAPSDGAVSLEGNGTFTIDGTTIKVESANSSDKNVLFFNGATLSGISSANGTITLTPTGIKNYTVNNQTFTISSATELKPLTETSIEITSPNNLVYDSMTINGGATADIGGDNVTLASGATVTGTKPDKNFTISGTVKFDNVTFTNANNTAVKYASAADKTWTIGTSPLYISGDTEYTISVSENKISQIGGNVTIDGAFAYSKTIETNSAGKFKIGTSDEFTITGDNSVTFTTDANGKVTAITNLSGTVEGNFTSEISVNGQAVQVSNDNTIGAVGSNDSGVTELNKLTGGITVTQSGGATKLSTDSTGNFTFGSQTFSIGGDSNVDFTKDSAAATVKGVSNLDNGNSIVFYQGETGFNVDNDTITLTSASSPVTLKVDGNNISEVKNLQSNINGLQANTKVQVATSNAISINTGLLQISESNADFTVNAANGGYNSIGGINSSAQITTAKNASVVTDATGTYTFPASHTFTIANNSGNVTLNTNADSNVTAIGGLQDNSNITFSSAESNLKVGNDTVTFTDENLKLTMGNNTVSGVESLTKEIKGLSANATVRVKTSTEVGINNTALHIAGDDDITVRAKSDGYDSVAGVNSGAQISVAAANTTLRTNEAGTFTFQRNGAYTTNDSDVAFVIGNNANYLDDIRDLDGQVQGDFTNEVKINGNAVKTANDTDIIITADSNGVTKIEKLTSPANDDAAIVYNAGGATTISTDNYGKFQFGNTNSHSFSISGGTANFQTASLSSWVPSVTGIRNIDNNASILVYQDETALTVENDTITLAANTSPVTLAMGGDTISSVTNITGKIDGLSEGAVVTVKDADVTINSTELQIEESGGTDFVAYSRANDGYVSITGVNNGATITSAKNTSVVADATGTYTFKNGEDVHKFEITDNNRAVTLKTDENGKVTAIDGLDVDAKLVLSQGETITINNKTGRYDFEIADSDAYATSPVTLTMGSGNTVKSVDNLKSNISGLFNNALITVTTGEEIEINEEPLRVHESGTKEYVVLANNKGYSSIAGVNGDATIDTEEDLDILTDIAGKFTFRDINYQLTSEYTISGDDTVSFKTDNGDVLSISSLESGTLQAAVKGDSADEVKVTLNGTALYSNDTDVSIVTADSAITSIIGLGDGGELTMPASTYVSVKGNYAEVVDVTINNDKFSIAGDSDGIVISEGGKVITGLNGDARLTVSAADDFTVNGTALTIARTLDGSLRVFIGESVNGANAASARLYQEGEISFGDYTPADEIAQDIMSSIDSDIDLANATVSVDGTSATASEHNQVVIVSETITGDTITVNLSGNSDLAIIRRNDVNITASGTGDTVISSGTDVKVEVGDNASNTVIMPTDGSLTIKNYNPDKASIQLTNSDVAAAVRDKTLKFTEDNIQVGNATVTTDASGYISFISSTGEEQKVAYAGYKEKEDVQNEYSFDASGYEGKEGDSKGVVIIGKEGSKNEITGSSKNDSAFGGTGDYFDMGKGDNYVEISTVQGGTGASSIIAESGNTTVKGFKFEDSFEDSDIAKFSEISSDTTATFDGKNVIITNGDKATLTLEVDGTKEVVNVNITDGTKENDELKIVKTAIVKDGADITVASATNANDFADAYVGGKNSGVDLTKFIAEATVNVDLSEGTGKFGTSDVTFRDIARVKGSDGEHLIKGAAGKANTIEAGKGSATIWGYGEESNDLLIGNSEQTKSSTFIFDGADGNDTIEGFQFYKFTLRGGSGSEVTNEPTPTNANASVNSAKADVLFLKEEHWQTLEDIVIKDDNVVIQMTDSEDNSITIKDAKDTAFLYKFQRAGVADGSNIESWVTKISDDKITYDGVTQFYKTTSKNATLEVSADYLNNDSSYSDSSIIYLNGKVNGLGKQETLEGIDSRYPIVGLDASSVTAAVTLVGNSANNVIKIGSVGGGLWGTEYSFGNDLLIGGAGSDTFVCGTGEGDDTVQNFSTDDVIYIHNKTLDDLKEEVAKKNIKITNPNSDTVKIQFSSGSITVVKDSDYTADVKFKLKYNQTYDGIDALKTAINLASSGDLAEDWGDNFNYDTPIDSEPVFWNGESADLSTDEVNNISELYRETSIGEIQFSITGAESFVDEIKSTAKK